jgi:hypothetical protein
MPHLKNQELDDRIHSFLNRKFAEIASVQPEPFQSLQQPKTPLYRKPHWGRA